MATPQASSLSGLVNYLVPANGNTHGVRLYGTFSATPYLYDWANFSVNNFKFLPQGVFVDNTQGTGDLTVTILPMNWSFICKAGTSSQFQFPAPDPQQVSITGNGYASLIFVDFPVLPSQGEVNIGNQVSVSIASIASGVVVPVVPTPDSQGLPYQVSEQPFYPGGNTQLMNVGTASSASAALPSGSTSVRLMNYGGGLVYTNFGAAASIPTSGASAAGFPLLPNSSETFSVPNGTTVNAIAVASGSILYITPGEGS